MLSLTTHQNKMFQKKKCIKIHGGFHFSCWSKLCFHNNFTTLLVLPPRTHLHILQHCTNYKGQSWNAFFFRFFTLCLNHTCMFRVIYWKMISFMLYRGQNREAEIKLIFSLLLVLVVVCMSGSEWFAFAMFLRNCKIYSSIKSFFSLSKKYLLAYQAWTNILNWSLTPDISSIHSI